MNKSQKVKTPVGIITIKPDAVASVEASVSFKKIRDKFEKLAAGNAFLAKKLREDED